MTSAATTRPNSTPLIRSLRPDCHGRVRLPLRLGFEGHMAMAEAMT